MLAASSRARASFPQAVRRWRARPGDKLEVEVPFREGNSTEWMWMSVDSLDERPHGREPTRLHGRLLNEPSLLPGLTAFTPVENDAAELFDWRLLSPDGGVEGGETLRLLQPR